MAATRTQLTTYLSGDEQAKEWHTVKLHYGESLGDAAILRHLIHDKFVELVGVAETPADHIDRELREIRSEQARQLDILRLIGEKVGVVV